MKKIFFQIAAFLILLSASKAFAGESCSDYTAKGDYEKAIAACSEAMQKTTKPEDLAVLYLTRGLAYGSKGRIDEAFGDYNKAIETNPGLAPAYNNRGLVYAGKGLLGEAMADYNKAIELDPSFELAYYNRAATHMSAGRMSNAVNDLTLLLKINPKFAQAYLARGLAYDAQGMLKAALADFAKALEINPKYEEVYISRGNAHFARELVKEAAADFGKAVQINPKNAANYFSRANALAAAGKFDDAIADYSKVVEMAPRSEAAYLNRGYVYATAGQHALAMADFTRALEINPRNEYTYIWLVITSSRVSKTNLDDALARLRNHVANVKSEAWVRTIAAYYLGISSLTENQIIKAAGSSADEKERKNRLSEAYYYLAEMRVSRGDINGAAELFKKAVEIKMTTSVEYMSSRANLERINAKTSKQ